MSDHISLAREYIAKGEEYYAKAANEIAAWLAEDSSRTQRQVADLLGRSAGWVNGLVRWRTSVQDTEQDSPASPWANTYEERIERAGKQALRDPEQRKQAIASLSSEEIEDVIAEAQTVAVDRVRAQRSEHDTTPKEPTAGDLMGCDRWDPSESWSDTLLIRCNRNLREMAQHVQKWGGVLGSMSTEEAYEYAQETERLAAEVRVIFQEKIRDRAEV